MGRPDKGTLHVGPGLYCLDSGDDRDDHRELKTICGLWTGWSRGCYQPPGVRAVTCMFCLTGTTIEDDD